MSYRSFLDEEGTLWQVWDVRPEDAERRMRERRLRHDPPETERRGVLDRRGDLTFRSDLPPELRAGWLVFQSTNVKRRYWPIPAQWEQLSMGDIRMLCQLAQTVARVDTGALMETQRAPRPAST